MNDKQPAKPSHTSHYSRLAKVKTSVCMEEEEASRHLHRMAQETAGGAPGTHLMLKGSRLRSEQQENHRMRKVQGSLPLPTPPALRGWLVALAEDFRDHTHLTPAASGSEAVSVEVPPLASACFAFV